MSPEAGLVPRLCLLSCGHQEGNQSLAWHVASNLLWRLHRFSWATAAVQQSCVLALHLTQQFCFVQWMGFVFLLQSLSLLSVTSALQKPIDPCTPLHMMRCQARLRRPGQGCCCFFSLPGLDLQDLPRPPQNPTCPVLSTFFFGKGSPRKTQPTKKGCPFVSLGHWASEKLASSQHNRPYTQAQILRSQGGLGSPFSLATCNICFRGRIFGSYHRVDP